MPGASSYHVMVDQNPHFTGPLVDQLDVRSTGLQLRGLVPGRYFWRVAAIGPDRVEGRFSEPSRIVVATPGTLGRPPTLQIERVEARGSIVQVTGRTDPAASVMVNGLPTDVRADGTFTEFVRLPPGAAWEVVVQAAAPDGAAVEQRRSVRFE
jgi:hypothetical protein